MTSASASTTGIPRPDRAPAELLSIDHLLGHIGRDKEWKLSIAQRPFEWQHGRVTSLVDSVIRGFPIGTILVIEQDGAAYDMHVQRGLRKVRRSERPRTQVLDGQQRCAALLASFEGLGLPERRGKGREYLWINVAAPNHRRAEFGDFSAHEYYFHWSTKEEINDLSGTDWKVERLPPRSPGSGWLRFDHLVIAVRAGESATAIARQAGVTSRVVATTVSTIEALRKGIVDALQVPRVPVHRLSTDHDGVSDLHQVFIRINAAGMPLSAVDEFFAGVKRFWPDAEEHLEPLMSGDSLLGRRDAITLLARCAGVSMARDPFDPVRLGLGELARASHAGGNRLVERMMELSPRSGSAPLPRAVDWVSGLLHRRLFAAARSVPPALQAVAIAWAFGQLIRGRRLPRRDSRKDTDPIIRFLFWSAVCGSRTYGRGRFDRRAFGQAWSSGRKGRPFPANKRAFHALCFDYHYILTRLPTTSQLTGFDSLDDREVYLAHELMQPKAGLFLGVFQKLTHEPVDWDHIIAANYARVRMKDGRSAHKDYSWVHRVGNFAGIDATANRVFQDKPPSHKLGIRRAKTGKHYGNPEFIHVDPMLDDDDRGRALLVEELLEAGKTDDAGTALRRFVGERSMRIWQRVIAEVGEPPVVRRKTRGAIDLRYPRRRS